MALICTLVLGMLIVMTVMKSKPGDSWSIVTKLRCIVFQTRFDGLDNGRVGLPESCLLQGGNTTEGHSTEAEQGLLRLPHRSDEYNTRRW